MLWPRLLMLPLLLLLAAPAPTLPQEAGFQEWLEELRREALAAGVAPETLDAALTGVEPIARVIELDRRQPELTWTLEQYLTRIVSEERVARGREKLQEHGALLDAVAKKYGVQARFLTALWGIETNYGQTSGGFQVIPALATLAHDGRRSAFFRRELLLALRILDQGHVTPDRMVGSWAGAMGQMQFMPSTFVSYAVDGSGDGKIDLWGSREDAFASAANYLSRMGWDGARTWGRPVRLPPGFDGALLGLEVRKPLEEWQALGVRRGDGGGLPRVAGLPASVIQPDGPGTPAYLVYDNFRTLMRWNRSQFFGIAVGTLADRIGG
ncbi:MAG: lytic murein transglycosylase [Deferrisomatales bacterium]|nr:lytic murein transglycosylase [Deferrisomatales bacterium]